MLWVGGYQVLRHRISLGSFVMFNTYMGMLVWPMIALGWAIVPMDETLAQVAVDLSGRPSFVFNVQFKRESIGSFPAELVEEFFKAVATNARMSLHISVPYGTNNHHIAEAIYKALAKALRQAVIVDPRNTGIPSTKGSLQS